MSLHTLITEFQTGNPGLMISYKWPRASECTGLLILDYVLLKLHRCVRLAARVEAP